MPTLCCIFNLFVVYFYSETEYRSGGTANEADAPEKGRLGTFGGAHRGRFACVTLIQFISGRIDGVASMVFLLAVFLFPCTPTATGGGVAGSVISVLAVNFAFRTPYFAFNFTIPENIFSGVVMLVVSFMTSTLTTRIKKQEQLRMESETEKMRANLLRAVSHDLRTPLTSIYGACSTVIDNYDSLGREQTGKAPFRGLR